MSKDSLMKCVLVSPQSSRDSRKNAKSNATSYECFSFLDDVKCPRISCLADILFPPKRKLLPAELLKLNSLATLLCVFTLLVALALSVVCYATYSGTNSSGIFAYAFDALLQAISSLMLIWRFSSFTNVSTDDKETIATLGVAFVNAVSAISIIVPTILSVTRKEKETDMKITVIVASIGVTLYFGLFYIKFKLSRKLGSSALMTDTMDSLGGSLMGLGVLVSSLVVLFSNKAWLLDDIIALIIAGLMCLYAAVVMINQVKICTNSNTHKTAK
ncbi:transmembrane protein 163-like [Dendronephthya gigantea]|uniref:transmembrane protein 163-like n=1 Tax=Dendronephthya gigantea TaxID=151771 RepID=UPI00106D9494|nr:transmembrane protein 163-like [Dendronephthya gigantea]